MKRILIVALALFWVSSAHGGEYNKTNTFSSGTTALSAEVNTNFDEIETAVDDNAVDIVALEALNDRCNITIESADAADDIMCGKATSAITLLNLDCTADGGTANLVLEVYECDATGDTCAASGGTVTVNDLISNFNDTTFTDGAIDDGDWWGIFVVSVTSAPTYVHCQVEFSR